MFTRRKYGPPPPSNAPGMTLEEAMQKTKVSTSSSSKPSSSSTSKPKEKTAYEIEIVDKTAVSLPIVDRTAASRKEEKTVSTRDREKEREKEKQKEKEKQREKEKEREKEKQREKEKEREKEKQKEKERQREKSAVTFVRIDESSKPRRTGLREDTKYPFDYEDVYEPSPSPAPSAKQASHFPSIRARTIVSSSRCPPPSTPSTLRRGDESMAQRQTRYDSLPPAEKERQKTWVQDYLSRAAPCPADFPWRREDKHYRCYGSSHVITDELIAEGRGGFYIYTPALYNDPNCTIPFFGPYYPTSALLDIIYVYSGSQPKPRHAPDRMIGLVPEWEDESAHFELTQMLRRNRLNWTIEDMVALNPALLSEGGQVNYAVLNKINEIGAKAQRKQKEMQRRQRRSGGR